jgi:hydroxypyruvate reductase
MRSTENAPFCGLREIYVHQRQGFLKSSKIKEMNAEKFLTHTLRTKPWGQTAAKTLAAAIEAVDPYTAVQTHLSLTGQLLHLGGLTYNLKNYRRIYLIGAGKAGLPMAQAVVDTLGNKIAAGLVIVKEGYGGVEKIGQVQIAEAGHPLPDARGVSATAQMLALLQETQIDDLVLVLISGGGSALLTAPVQGVDLDDLRTLTEILLGCGADIVEINTLRKRLDTVKGGGLAQAAAPAKVASLILSDVVGDPLDKIASGPTVLERSRKTRSSAILEKYGLKDEIPASILRALSQPAQPPPFAPSPPNNVLVGNNEIAACAAIEKAKSFGFYTELLTTTLQGEARLVGEEMAELLRTRSAQEHPGLWVAGGETTVTIAGNGLGGRNQELALAAVRPLDGVPDVALISLATDGGDGPTSAAGAVVTGETYKRAISMGLAPDAYLANNDSHTFFSALEDCLLPGPTRTNVNDLLFLFSF